MGCARSVLVALTPANSKWWTARHGRSPAMHQYLQSDGCKTRLDWLPGPGSNRDPRINRLALAPGIFANQSMSYVITAWSVFEMPRVSCHIMATCAHRQSMHKVPRMEGQPIPWEHHSRQSDRSQLTEGLARELPSDSSIPFVSCPRPAGNVGLTMTRRRVTTVLRQTTLRT
jgi:hypothetical protein